MTSNASVLLVLHSLGKGKDRRIVVSSICLATITFFYFFVIGSAFQTKIYTFEHRVTYENIFQRHISTLNIDTIVTISATMAWVYFSLKNRYTKSGILIFFLFFPLLYLVNYATMLVLGAELTIPVIVALIIIDKFRGNKILNHDAQLSISYITVVTIVLASIGIISLTVFFINGSTMFEVGRYPYAVYQELLSILTPIVMAALVFCLPLKALLNAFHNKIKMKRYSFVLNTDEVRLPDKKVIIYLSVCIMLGIAAAVIPHSAVINPNDERLGVDTPRYVLWLNLMKNETAAPLQLAFKDIASGDRPLTLIILFLMAEVSKADPFQVAEYSPIIFAPLLVLVTFFLTRQLTSNDKISIISSFLSAISFQTLIGIYSGFYANWLALILGYLVFALLVRNLKTPSKFSAAALAITMGGVLLAHVYTWTIIISVAFVFLFVVLLLNYYPRRRIFVLYLIISSSIAVDIFKSTWIGSSSGLEVDLSVGVTHGLEISQFGDRLKTLADTVQTYYGGAYANIAILGLVLYWLIHCRARELANIFMMIFFSTALVPLFLGDFVLQSRVLYNVPFQIPAAISLYYIGRKNGKLISIALLLITGYLSLHVLANLGYLPPPKP